VFGFSKIGAGTLKNKTISFFWPHLARCDVIVVFLLSQGVSHRMGTHPVLKIRDDVGWHQTQNKHFSHTFLFFSSRSSEIRFDQYILSLVVWSNLTPIAGSDLLGENSLNSQNFSREISNRGNLKSRGICFNVFIP